MFVFVFLVCERVFMKLKTYFTRQPLRPPIWGPAIRFCITSDRGFRNIYTYLIARRIAFAPSCVCIPVRAHSSSAHVCVYLCGRAYAYRFTFGSRFWGYGPGFGATSIRCFCERMFWMGWILVHICTKHHRVVELSSSSATSSSATLLFGHCGMLLPPENVSVASVSDVDIVHSWMSGFGSVCNGTQWCIYADIVTIDLACSSDNNTCSALIWIPIWNRGRKRNP